MCLFLQILVELEDEYMGEVHPLLDMVLGKEVPIAVVGHGKAVKFLGDQLRRLDSLRLLAVDHCHHP